MVCMVNVIISFIINLVIVFFFDWFFQNRLIMIVGKICIILDIFSNCREISVWGNNKLNKSVSLIIMKIIEWVIIVNVLFCIFGLIKFLNILFVNKLDVLIVMIEYGINEVRVIVV